MEASAAIPLIFPPVIINNDFYIDGCTKCVDGVCKDILNNNKNDKYFIIKGNYKKQKINSLIDYLSEVMNCTFQNEDEIDDKYTICIYMSDEFKVKLNFNDINNSLKLQLFYNGLEQAKNKIKNLI